MRRLTFVILALAVSSVKAQVPMLLTGQVKAKDSQVFYAPRSDNWRVQVQWMLPEGDVAKEGDVVVVYDSGTILSSIEQEENSLILAEDELHRVESETKQSLIEAEHYVNRSKLLLEKARIDAEIGEEYLSTYEYQEHQLDYEKAVVEHAKSLENLKQVKVANGVSIRKKQLTIEKHKAELAYNREKLKNMSGRAKSSGPIIYAKHPWNGEKVFVGMTAQPSWKIAEIPANSGKFVEAWLHEVDFRKVKKGDKATMIFDAFPDKQFPTEVIEISSQPEERTDWGEDVYYKLLFTLNNIADFDVLSGMNVQIELAEANQ